MAELKQRFKVMKFYTQEEMETKHVGAKDSAARQTYDRELELFKVGEAIRQARQSQHLTQSQLGELVGVQKAQISRLEKGQNLTLSSVARLFGALNFNVSLDISRLGRVALC